MDQSVSDLTAHGYAWIRADFQSVDAAFGEASRLIDRCRGAKGLPPLAMIGDFVLPPADGHESRPFQTLHCDFGVPLDPRGARDVARYTALHIPKGRAGLSAVTRFVPLADLLGQRAWPCRGELINRLATYGSTHGAWDGTDGYSEGSLARIVEAAAGSTPELPSVKADPEFLCGMEFDSLNSELRFFERHHLDVEAVQIEIVLSPGDLFVFDNLMFAHGRRGSRRPGELHQRIFGHRGLEVCDQQELREQILRFFSPRRPLVDLEAVRGDEMAVVVVET